MNYSEIGNLQTITQPSNSMVNIAMGGRGGNQKRENRDAAKHERAERRRRNDDGAANGERQASRMDEREGLVTQHDCSNEGK